MISLIIENLNLGAFGNSKIADKNILVMYINYPAHLNVYYARSIWFVC